MKQVAFAAAALIVGLMLGGLQPRAQVRDLEQQLAEAERPASNAGLGEDLAEFFGRAGGNAPRPCLPTDEAIRWPEASAEANPEAVELVDEINAEIDSQRDELESGLENLGVPADAELELARTALDLRRAQSRAALVQDTDADDDQLAEIDAAYSQMNDVLVDLSSELVDMLAEGRTPSRRDAMEFTADALDAMLIAEQSVEGVFDEDQRGELGEESLNPFNYIDPAIVDTLRDLDQLEL
ncbi:MAG: hypothetical protein GY898_06940 [Proteobacteria bacterium]|nr:hypothetical protein [Pseudomonadota bacterium]